MAGCLLLARPMHGRLSFLAFVVYVALDLSNPFIAGAFNFNPDECVEGLHRTASSHQRADAPALPSRAPVVRMVTPSPSLARPLAGGRYTVLEWLVGTRASGDPPPPAEDH